MNINLGRIAFGRGAYLLFLVSVIIALAFVGIPFVVRSVQPVLADTDQEIEEIWGLVDDGTPVEIRP